jgi:hypothetical protein
VFTLEQWPLASQRATDEQAVADAAGTDIAGALMNVSGQHLDALSGASSRRSA